MAAFSLLFNPVLVPDHFQPYVCLLSHLSLIHGICCSHLVKYIIHKLKRHKISFLHQECESQTAISWKRDMTCMNGVQRVLKKYEESGQWEQQMNSICSHRNRKKIQPWHRAKEIHLAFQLIHLLLVDEWLSRSHSEVFILEVRQNFREKIQTVLERRLALWGYLVYNGSTRYSQGTTVLKWTKRNELCLDFTLCSTYYHTP